MSPEEIRILTAVLITVIVLAIILGFFVWSLIRQHRRAIKFQQQMVLTEMTTLEKERARVASDLHDELGPVLSVIKFRVDHAKHLDEELETASEQLNSIVNRVREIAANLMPSSLTKKGLSAAVREYSAEIQSARGVTVDTDLDELDTLAPEQQLHLFRIFQESVHNAVKHSGSPHIKVWGKLNSQGYQLICRDYGRGLDREKKDSGIGMFTLARRAEILGGKLSIHSEPGRGVELIFDFKQPNS